MAWRRCASAVVKVLQWLWKLNLGDEVMIQKTYKHFRICRDDRDVVTVWIGHATRSMNVFDDEVIAELQQVVADLEGDDHARAVVFRSSKETGFMAGADVGKIASVTIDEVGDILLAGQSLFTRIEKLSVPTLAVISGPCLGGGLEFALACRYRIAQENASTRLGLPEVQLGVIPGWGGTQRLPARVGLMQALPMILQGKKLPAGKALKIGLVDAIADEAGWKTAVDEFIDRLLREPETPNHVPTIGLWNRMLDRTVIGRRLVMHGARKRIAKESEHYPALAAALRAIEASYDKTVDGFAVERTEFSKLIETRTCRNLLELFFRRERARSVDTWRSTTEGRGDVPRIAKLGIIGAGAMGAGIGQLAALKGFDVVMKEINDSLAEAGMKRVKDLIDDMVSSRRLPKVDGDDALQRVRATSDWSPLEDADLVIEAVVEREDVKDKVFRELSKHVKSSGVLATNTSSLSVARMAGASDRPDRVAGLHFFNPVHRMELVEVVRADSTSAAVVEQLVAFVRQMGKTPIVTSDSPGFLVNRILFPYIGEAIQLVCDGESVEQIDRQARRFGMPMGPLELLDHVGLDVAYHVSGSLETVLKDNQRVIDLLGKLVAAGWIGRKSGQGFYEYREGKRRG
ncbi:MAG: 3-hydroxyacyl-CoA dehydrogenase NAD-binding domain-containing protein [Pirellulaceae bacterium]